MIRSFIAIEVSKEVKNNIAALTAKLGQSRADVKWVSALNLHITLKFLGDIREEDIANIRNVIKESAAGVKPFDLTVEGAGAFPDLKRPRVVFACLTGETANLASLNGKLDENLADFNVKKENRKFSPHLTIGRVRSRKNSEALSELIEKSRAEYFGAIKADSIVLMMSELQPKGPLYSVMDRIKL